MKIILWILFLLIAIALQLTIAPRIAILSVAPNLFLSGILAVAIWRRENKNDWWVLIPILVFDLIAGRPFGFLTLILWLIFFAIDRLGLLLFKKDDAPAVLSLAVIGVLFFETALFLGRVFLSKWQLMEPAQMSFFYFYAILPVTLLYNGALVWLFFWCLNNLKVFYYYGSFAKLR